MTPLSNQQKQLLFDYCIGLTSEKESAEAEVLISADEEAAKTHAKLKAALSPLETAEIEPCPDDLAEGTVWRLNNLARSGQLQLQQLLAREQSQQAAAKSRFWWNLGKMAAAAAVIVFVAGVLIAPLNFARQKSWQQRCQMQLQQIWHGVNNYSFDHDGKLPAVATTMGAPWWKVGYQGSENYSNTRHIWLLAKGGYVKPDNFVCPGKKHGRTIQLDASQVRNLSDFPDRHHITYSLRIKSSRPATKISLGRKVLMSDLNPLFENLPPHYSNSFELQLNKDLLTRNSTNHNRRGQNVLFDDGSVPFVKVRRIGVAEDDIFTLRDTDIYQGIEVPASEADAFLAP